MMKSAKFIELAIAAGFKPEQADFIEMHLSQKPHTHTADQITDFEDAVIETIEETEE